MRSSLSVIILSYNEEIHIERCLNSIKDIAQDIYLVDSYSNDNTIKIAKKVGAKVIQNKWPGNHSKQFNWALESLDIKTNWVMRLDADEFIEPGLANEITTELSITSDIKGFYLKRGHIFLGKKIRYGGNYPLNLLRIWKNGFGKCEDILMDEHILIDKGCKTKILKGKFWDHNLNNISTWTEKHNSYSTKEAIMQIQNSHFRKTSNSNKNFKRLIKYEFYEKLPKSFRAFLYFIYRYVFRFGFLDGYRGLIWNFLQAFWYRFLVDVKVYEIQKKANDNNLSIKEILKREHDYELKNH